MAVKTTPLSCMVIKTKEENSIQLERSWASCIHWSLQHIHLLGRLNRCWTTSRRRIYLLQEHKKQVWILRLSGSWKRWRIRRRTSPLTGWWTWRSSRVWRRSMCRSWPTTRLAQPRPWKNYLSRTVAYFFPNASDVLRWYTRQYNNSSSSSLNLVALEKVIFKFQLSITTFITLQGIQYSVYAHITFK